MNRAEIKEAAKAKIRGNKWNIWWPYICISIITSVLSSLFSPKVDINTLDFNNFSLDMFKMTPIQTAGTTVVGLLSAILTACYLKYIIDFVRTGKFNHDVIIKTLKEKWVNLLVANLIGGLLIGLGMVLFVIPGIILALAYALVDYVILDTKLSGVDALKKCREMMKGYKWDYFVFGLSFIGWCLLIVPTFGLIMIWLFPYMTVANAMYYDKLKNKTGK